MKSESGEFEVETIDFYKAIEILNAEYLEIFNSNEYILGKRIIKFLRLIKSFKILELSDTIKSFMTQKIVVDGSGKVNERIEFCNGKNISNSNGIVYTCITGGYETEVKEPLLLPKELFFVITDTPELCYGKKCTCQSIDNNVHRLGSLYQNRFYKMHPFIFKNKYSYSMYIDGNVRVIGNIKGLFSIAHEAKTGIAMHRHNSRNCVYDEAIACVKIGAGNKEKIIEQIKRYRTEGFPSKFGLCEATIIVTDLENPVAEKIMSDWWNEFKSSESCRDQLSLSYVLWKNGYTIEDVGYLGNNLLRNPKFRIEDYGKHSLKRR